MCAHFQSIGGMSKRFRTEGGAARFLTEYPTTDVLNFEPLTTDPAAGGEGDVYYNSTAKTLKLYDGTEWHEMAKQKVGVVSTGKLTDGVNDFTMSIQRGNWIRVGDQVTVNAYLGWSSVGSASGPILLEDLLPYQTFNDSSAAFIAGNISGWDGFQLGGSLQPGVRTPSNSSTISMIQSDASVDTGVALMAETDFAAGGLFYLSMTYYTSVAF